METAFEVIHFVYLVSLNSEILAATKGLTAFVVGLFMGRKHKEAQALLC